MSEQVREQSPSERKIVSDDLAGRLDAEAAALVGSMAAGLDVRRVALAYVHWCVHLGMTPGKAAQLVELWLRQNAQLGAFALKSTLQKDVPRVIEPGADDRRFADAGWRQPPFSILEQCYLPQR